MTQGTTPGYFAYTQGASSTSYSLTGYLSKRHLHGALI